MPRKKTKKTKKKRSFSTLFLILLLALPLSLGCLTRFACQRTDLFSDTSTNSALSQTAIDSVVNLGCYTTDTHLYLGHGSGVYVSPTHILTANHVPQGCSSWGGTLWDDNNKVPLTFIKGNEIADLALMSSNGATPNQPFSKVGVEPKLGDSLYVVGFPSTFRVKIITKGIVSFYYQENGEVRYVTDAAITFGDSGGGAFDESGNLIGIVSALVTSPITGDNAYRLGLLVTHGEIVRFLA